MGRRRAPPRVRANRLNAKKSTGPRTILGKQRSAQNAILHGLSAKTKEFSSHPEMDGFLELLCEGDERLQVIEAAREVADAQSELNTIRQYRLILQRLKAKGRSAPVPGSDLLDDPVISEFMDYMATGESFDFGVREKADYRLHKRILHFMFQQARRSKNPDVEIIKLNRYEGMAMQRRLAAIEKLDAARGLILDDTSLPSSSRAHQVKWPKPRVSAIRVDNGISV